MKKKATSVEQRIAAWKAQRAKIAETDKATRKSKRKATMPSREANPETVSRGPTLTLLRSDKEDRVIPEMSAAEIVAKAPKPAQTDQPQLRISSLFMALVIAPVCLAACYLFFFATPLYEAQSVVAITKSTETVASGGTGLLGSLEGTESLAEVYRADEYIGSQALMDSLESEMGLVTYLSSDAVDPLRRLRTVPLLSWSKKMQFDRFVEASIDIRSGLLTLYVRAPDQQRAIDISTAVLRNAEFQVSHLGEQLFENRQSFATNMRRDAEAQVAQAQSELVALQLKYQEVDPRVQVENIYSRIKDLEDQAQEIRNQIQTAQISGLRNNSRTEALSEIEARLQDQIAQERSKLVDQNGPNEVPLNNLLMEYELANLNVELAREAVKTAIEAQAEAGREAALNRSFFQVVVPPRTAQTAVYPKIPGVLALIFVICLSLYAAIHALRKSKI